MAGHRSLSKCYIALTMTHPPWRTKIKTLTFKIDGHKLHSRCKMFYEKYVLSGSGLPFCVFSGLLLFEIYVPLRQRCDIFFGVCLRYAQDYYYEKKRRGGKMVSSFFRYIFPQGIWWNLKESREKVEVEWRFFGVGRGKVEAGGGGGSCVITTQLFHFLLTFLETDPCPVIKHWAG